MDILRLFFWYCKENRIMDIVTNMYYASNNLFTRYYYDMDFMQIMSEQMTFKDYISQKIKDNGFLDLFWIMWPNTVHINRMTDDERFKKARSKWNRFVKNNIRFSDKFIKIGDSVEIKTSYGENFVGTVCDIPQIFDNSFSFKEKITDKRFNIVINNNIADISVNGEVREPLYCIKKNRTLYGN